MKYVPFFFCSATVISEFASDTSADFKNYQQHTDSLTHGFVIKWGGDATYNDVIVVIDQFKINRRKNYVLQKISKSELIALEKITGKQYPDSGQ